MSSSEKYLVDRPSRRTVLLGAASTAWAFSTGGLSNSNAQAKEFSEPVPESKGLSTYLNEGQVIVRWDNHMVLQYRADAACKYPHFPMLAGPLSGLPLTTESALPYPHHRGLWLGCDPLGGGDYWSDGPLETGQIISEGLSLQDRKGQGTTIVNQCAWKRGEDPPLLRDRRRVTFIRVSSQLHFLDIHLQLEAKENIRIRKAKHSFFALRVAPDLAPNGGGNLVNSNGDLGAKKIHGRSACWCGFFGTRKNSPSVVEGVSFFNHPDNFGGACPWFARDYGHLSPSPLGFLEDTWTLDRGQELSLRYGIVLHAGSPGEAGIARFFDQWLAKHPDNTSEPA